MAESLNVLLVGSGDMGRRHADAYHDCEGVRICGIADSDQFKAESLATVHGNPPVFNDYAEALKVCRPDVVSVCVPAFRHAEVSIAALEAGAYVLCEKPIALTLEEADAMIAAHEANGDRLGIVFQRRYSTLWQAAIERLPELGKPLMYHAFDFREVRPKLMMHSQSGNGGPVIDSAVHDFDMLLQLIGPVESVFAMGNVFAEGKSEVASVEDLAIDTAAINLRLTGGHSASVTYGWGMPAGFPEQIRNEILGPEGMLRLFPDRIEHYQGENLIEDVVGIAIDDGHSVQISEFVTAIRSGTTLPIPPTEARAALALAYAALASIESGDPVVVEA